MTFVTLLFINNGNCHKTLERTVAKKKMRIRHVSIYWFEQRIHIMQSHTKQCDQYENDASTCFMQYSFSEIKYVLVLSLAKQKPCFAIISFKWITVVLVVCSCRQDLAVIGSFYHLWVTLAGSKAPCFCVQQLTAALQMWQSDIHTYFRVTA